MRNRIAFPIAAMLLIARSAHAEDIVPYKLTGMDGYASLQYAADGQSVDQPLLPRSRQKQSGWRTELFAMTHSYVYHPNLMVLDVGGGPILHNEDFFADTGSARSRGMLYNFSARATLLRDKPYTGALFFSHLNPTVSLGPGMVLTQENTRYGFDFSLLAPATPVPLQANFLRSRTQGRGADRQLDDNTDQFSLTATRSFDALGSSQLHYQTSRQASRSGSLDLPLQSSTSANDSVSVDTRLQFGADRQYDLTNLVSINTQRYAMDTGAIPTLNDFRVLLDGRARHSKELHSFGFASYGHSSQGALDIVNRSVAAGLNAWPAKGLDAGVSLHSDDSNTKDQIETRIQSIDATLGYEHELPLGIGQVNLSRRLSHRDQVAALPQSAVIGEAITLTGTAFVGLSHPYVVAGSIVIANASRSQTYVAGVDYTLLVVGSETRLQRLVGGRILDGESVLVDYAYDTGGSYAYTQADRTINLNWNLSRYVSAYARRFDSDPRLTSGTSVFPLNEIHSRVEGARADLPFRAGIAMTAGASVERENRRETIAPFHRSMADAYLQCDEPLFDLGFMRLSTRRARIDYDNPIQDSRLRGSELRYWSRQWFGIDLNAVVGLERDDAGLLPRKRRDASLALRWQQRRLTLSGSFQHSLETQGGIERSRTSLQFQAVRELW